MVQKVCRNAEKSANMKDYTEYQKNYIAKRKQYIELRDFALKAARENRSNNPAMWQFTGAFLTLIDGDASLANQYLEQASEMNGTSFVKNSISTFKIFVDSYITAQCDSVFESLLPELKKLDKVKSIFFEKYKDNLFYSGEIYENPDLWWYPNTSTKNGFKKDEMNKITPAYLIPKYLELKDFTKVLLFAMAANIWTVRETLSEYPYKMDLYKDNMIYGTDIYFWMDVVPVENVIEFQQLYNTGGRNDLERFLLARCHISNDFLNELIGTKYLRAAQFEKAIPYLSKVPNDYIKKMNIYDYFGRNPFKEIIWIKEENRTLQKPYPAYKLNYAKRMLALQTDIKNIHNEEKKANALLQYAVALRRSASGESWALTDYFLGDEYGYGYNSLRRIIKDDWRNKLLEESDKYLGQATRITKNPEIKAKCYLAKNYSYYGNSGYWVNEKTNNYYYLINNYPETQVVKQFMSECDNFFSYYQPDYLKRSWAYYSEKNQ
jgi:hypothetical protein